MVAASTRPLVGHTRARRRRTRLGRERPGNGRATRRRFPPSWRRRRPANPTAQVETGTDVFPPLTVNPLLAARKDKQAEMQSEATNQNKRSVQSDSVRVRIALWEHGLHAASETGCHRDLVPTVLSSCEITGRERGQTPRGQPADSAGFDVSHELVAKTMDTANRITRNPRQLLLSRSRPQRRTASVFVQGLSVSGHRRKVVEGESGSSEGRAAVANIHLRHAPAGGSATELPNPVEAGVNGAQ
ncbi:hypothetical protein SKAU_G00304650 [Synaphobranchus kaupii]|uniref:Uncharacterized protein n=1 Tax=Synaphobranchus kaupii TaxID=118154 RepID=A0A9Q1IMM9_SYNKA|nr:hypothetical protein SKAU_G00304650 [Synaphobranchus kaupii]